MNITIEAARGGHRAERDAAILVDFDNLRPSISSATHENAFRHELLEYSRQVLRVQPDTDFIRIRLYGGWLQEGTLTQEGSRVQLLASAADPFPFVEPLSRRIIRGRIELATSLAAVPTVSFGDTYRRRGGAQRVRLSQSPCPDGCSSDAGACPMRSFSRLTRSLNGACPYAGCTVTAGRAFIVHEQKMVDTLIACDLLSFADELGTTVLVSGDSDFLPPLVRAAHTARVGIIDSQHLWSHPHRALFGQLGIWYIEALHAEP